MPYPAKKLKHPYITTDKNIRNGEPIIAGTGIRVLDIAVRYEVAGMTPEDIIIALPHLSLTHVHDALSYYYEHKSELDMIWKKSLKKVESIKKKRPSILENKIGKIKNLY